MPFVIYVFTLTAFALGLAEFVPIGLTAVMAQGMQVDLEQAGRVVTVYALGATFAAPVLTALTTNWPRKNAMLVTTFVFTAGSLVAALSTSLTVLLVARFIAGMGHGLFMSVASSTAARLAGPSKSGSAVAVVFGGFTLAMAIGVPISTYLGGVIEWRPVLVAVAAFGGLGFLGLLFGMRDPVRTPANELSGSPLQGLLAIFNGKLLAGALVTVFAYAGSFTAYTYIAPLLTQVTAVSTSTVSMFMMAYGVLAAIGNALGGKATDRFGVNRASVIVVLGIAVVALGMSLLATSATSMAVLVALLGMFTFAAVPALQARLIGIADVHAPRANGVAAGINIAGFNSGIAVGSVLGGLTINATSVAYTGVAGAIAAALGVLLLVTQVVRNREGDYRPVQGAAH